MKNRTGMYDWAGPGTLRMIDLKFFSPRKNTASIMGGYDAEVLTQLQRTLGITDAWVTYSWGFSDATEQEDYAFLRSKLPHFHSLGIAPHAYVQGTNLVYEEHKEKDYWCRDHAGKTIPYHRGRLLCCPNNPHFQGLLRRRVERACKENVAGVFVDNFHFGQFPVAINERSTFFGCACEHCHSAFRASTGLEIPHFHDLKSDTSKAYVDFRCESLHTLSRSLKEIARTHGKKFGSNSFDQNLDTRLFYGFDAFELQKIQDYLLFENFNYPSLGRSNAHHAPLIAGEKPVFIVSYKHVIGAHASPSQADIDAMYTESTELGYAPCYKASEFTTDGEWHNIDPSSLAPPQPIALPARAKTKARRAIPFTNALVRFCNQVDRPFLHAVYEYRFCRNSLGWIIDMLTARRFDRPEERLPVETEFAPEL